MENAVIYTRVATIGQTDQSQSLRNQEKRLKELCEKKRCKIIKHFSDSGIGDDPKYKPGWKALVSYLNNPDNKNIDYVVMTNPDRISSDMEKVRNEMSELCKHDLDISWLEGFPYMDYILSLPKN